ncbi:hypothetical protein F5144DRAFT_560888 [Chaetomium tenue]|uniref:Uncharacterized protein n=1 Tax=Chaetomium tenue TaxID=1854479 RepID=A0ACB7PG40_9PEZI|nr:hypothetical protein F5144DRAFT_560888 [Chaetomium globosum]
MRVESRTFYLEIAHGLTVRLLLLLWGATCRAVLLKVDLRDIQWAQLPHQQKNPAGGSYLWSWKFDGSRFINARCAWGHPFDENEALECSVKKQTTLGRQRHHRT